VSLLQGNASQNRAFNINQARVNKRGQVKSHPAKKDSPDGSSELDCEAVSATACCGLTEFIDVWFK